MKIDLTKAEIDMLIDAASRMQSDDVWDEYPLRKSKTLESAKDKLQEALAPTKRGD